MEKRSIIAIVLVFLILLIWPFIFNRKKPSDVQPQQQQNEVIQKKEEKPKPKEPEPKITSNIPKGSIISVQTPLYEAQLTTNDANIVSWKLKEYMNRTGESGYINLIPAGLRQYLTIKFDDPGIQKELYSADWESDKKSLILKDTPGSQDSINFAYTTSKGMKILKKMTFYGDSYIVDIDIEVQGPIVSGYNLVWGGGIVEDGVISTQELANEGPIAMLRTDKGSKLIKHWQKSGFGCVGSKQIRIPRQEGPIYWIGFASKYFTAVLIPGNEPWWTALDKAGGRYTVDSSSNETSLSPKDVWQNWAGTTTIGLTVPSNNTENQKFRAYIGPKKWSILRDIRKRDNTEENLNLGKMINFGVFSILGKATLWLLQVFYSVGKNYGIAIIFVSVLIKIIYLPLTQKSFNSMNKMQELQPKLNALREKYRDDPQRLNKETMKFYKQQGASPLGGCLPILLQIPVFWALFSTLRGAVELRGAVFISGWVNDLSLPDTVASIYGFPIRILPLLMTGSTLAQQFIFGTGSPGQNNKMMALMPVFMLFIFYGMPSGLVLYWFCNDIFSFVHRFLIKRSQKAAKIEENTNEKAKKETGNKTIKGRK